jgi:hypothetical protein
MNYNRDMVVFEAILLVVVLLIFLNFVVGCSSHNSSSTVPTPSPSPSPGANLQPQGGVLSGLSCNVYDLSVSMPQDLPNFNPTASQTILNGSQVSAGTPVSSFEMNAVIDFVTPQAILAGSYQTMTTWFALDCTGYMDVSEYSSYSFTINSDDGSQLLIDGLSVIDNDGLHAALPKQGDIVLPLGTHSVELQYFQGPGDAVLQLFSNLPVEFYQ